MSDEHESSKPIRPGRRRLVVRLAVVASVLVALVIVPGYIATRPTFFARYPSLDVHYKPWSASPHSDVACQDCHVRPALADRVSFALRMTGEFYLTIVQPDRAPVAFARPTNDSCLACHDGLVTTSPKGDLKIPHRAHVQVLKLECGQCHAFLVHELSPEGKRVPPMAACLKCHDGKQAKNTCAACHTNKAAPASHAKADWIVVHPKQRVDAECTKCHKWKADWCADCHSRRPTSHVAKWRTIHGATVTVRRNCETCHGAPFCVRCHGEVPAKNFDPALKLVK